MIRIEHVKTDGWEAAIRGMRNPLNSWSASDSTATPLDIGYSDFRLMKKLVRAGSDEAKFLRQINISMDITAPEYWWAQFDTYKVGVTRISCSKMHKLMSKPFEVSDFSFDHLPGYKNEPRQYKPDADEAKEIWVPYGAKYQVSNMGRVKSFAHKQEKFLSGSLHMPDGYVFVSLYGNQQPLHKIVAELFCGGRTDERRFVNHKDGNKQNNAASNLEWVTQAENIAHSRENHLQPNPVKTYKGKFTEEEREEIKRLNEVGISKREIARQFEVSHTCICDITNGRHSYMDKENVYQEAAKPLVQYLNELRSEYLSAEDAERKRALWNCVMALLPQSYNQLSTVTLNYEVARRQYNARKAHKLDEWKYYCAELAKLPYSELITGESN